ncbi:MAG: hypothetical protein AAB131_00335 [Actinomycetota bacterium]|jgi:hypothetical protein
MSNDLLPNGKAALPPRAAIGLLTLELRALLREESAAAAAPPFDELRAKLEPLVEQRRAELDAELEQARAASAAAVVAARRAASVIVAQAAHAAQTVQTVQTGQAVPPAKGVELAVEKKVAIVPIVAATSAPQWAAPVAAAPAVVVTVPESPLPVVAIAVAGVVSEPTPAAPGVAALSSDERPLPDSSEPAIVPTQAMSTELVKATADPATSVVVDAQAFATMFATVLGTMLDERFNNLGPRMSVVQAPAVAPTPVKRGFWTHAKHPDVILLALTTAIVLVVLAAWLA